MQQHFLITSHIQQEPILPSTSNYSNPIEFDDNGVIDGSSCSALNTQRYCTFQHKTIFRREVNFHYFDRLETNLSFEQQTKGLLFLLIYYPRRLLFLFLQAPETTVDLQRMTINSSSPSTLPSRQHIVDQLFISYPNFRQSHER